MHADAVSSSYIRLAFELERHLPGLIDGYFGPAELRPPASVARDPARLVPEIAALRQQLQGDTLPAARREFLDRQLRALETMARRLAGEPLSFRDEVRLLFDIEPHAVSERLFDQAIADLDACLPGNGPINERMNQWKKGFEIDTATALRMVERIVAEARQRSLAHFPLPEAESLDVAFVTDQPWSGYNWYFGNYRSRIDINTDLPIRANSLLDLICHEAYPGHHSEHAIKEHELLAIEGRGEHAILLINTPECVISEGIATLAADIIFGDEAFAWAASEMYPLAGIDSDPQREATIAAASRNLRALAANAALLLHEQGADPEEVVAYIMRYGLRNESEARQSLRFISDPLWRAYVFTYYVGRELLGDWIDRGDRIQRFGRLLREPFTPSQIVASMAA